MGLVTWTAVFTCSAPRDSADEVGASINGLIGADLQRRLRPRLRDGGWDFCEAWPEDHGWHAEAAVKDEETTLGADLVTCPELDEADADGGALDGRWRVVIGLDLGLLPRTKARRKAILIRLADGVETACRALGTSDFTWEVGGVGPNNPA